MPTHTHTVPPPSPFANGPYTQAIAAQEAATAAPGPYNTHDPRASVASLVRWVLLILFVVMCIAPSAFLTWGAWVFAGVLTLAAVRGMVRYFRRHMP